MSRLGLTREQLAALGALLVVLLGCVLAAGYSLSLRGDAADELAERRELLARLARAPAGAAGASGPARIVEAPAAAFIDAPTHGQAGAQLQSYFARLATEQNATVALSGVEAATREAPDDVLVQATLEISLDALQALLYQLETGNALPDGRLVVGPAGEPGRATEHAGRPVAGFADLARPVAASRRMTSVASSALRALAALCLALWFAPAAVAQAPAERAAELSNPLGGLTLQALSATRERPLFAPTRRPPAPPPPPPPEPEAPPPAEVVEAPPVEAPPPPPPEPPAVTLFGVVAEAEGARAIVRGPGEREPQAARRRQDRRLGRDADRAAPAGAVARRPLGDVLAVHQGRRQAAEIALYAASRSSRNRLRSKPEGLPVAKSASTSPMTLANL